MRTLPILFASFLTGCLAAPVHAQDAFSHISIRGGGVLNINHTVFHTWWQPGRGGELALATPFHAGEVEGGAALHQYTAAGPDIPSFRALFVFVGWGTDFLPDRIRVLSWQGGFRIGNYRMAFDENTFPGIRNESELTLGIVSRIDVRIVRNARAYVAGQFLRTWTAPRFDTVYLSVGVRHTFRSPGWLRAFLR